MNDGMYLPKWLKSIGVSRTTGWRLEKRGRITVKRIYGRKYIEQCETERRKREGEQNGLAKLRLAQRMAETRAPRIKGFSGGMVLAAIRKKEKGNYEYRTRSYRFTGVFDCLGPIR